MRNTFKFAMVGLMSAGLLMVSIPSEAGIFTTGLAAYGAVKLTQKVANYQQNKSLKK